MSVAEKQFFVMMLSRTAADQEFANSVEAAFTASNLAATGAEFKAKFLERFPGYPWMIKSPIQLRVSNVDARIDVTAYALLDGTVITGWGYDMLIASHGPSDISNLDQAITNAWKSAGTKTINDASTKRSWYPDQTANLSLYQIGSTYMWINPPALRRHSYG